MSIYFVQRADGLIKVGFSDDFENRFDRLSKSHPGLKVIRVIEGDRRREKSFHHALRSHHEYGEWFRPEPEVFDFIENVEDGNSADVQPTRERAAWVRYEIKHSAKCTKAARELYSNCYGMRGDNFSDVSKYIEVTHGIPARVFLRLFQGGMRIPSSALMERVRQAHIHEMKAILEHLLSEIAVKHRQDEMAAEEITFPEQIASLQARLDTLRGENSSH